MRKTVV